MRCHLVATVFAVSMSIVACQRSTESGKDAPGAKASITGGEVTDVVKGDEIVIRADGEKATVRLLGLHAFADIVYDPDLAAFGRASKSYLEDLLVGKKVELQLNDPPQDIHGRYLAYVYQGGADQNLALLRAGQAVVYTEFAFDREAAYLAAEAQAREQKKGLWADPKATRLVRSLRALWTQASTRRGQASPDDPLTKEDLALPPPASAAELDAVPEPELPE